MLNRFVCCVRLSKRSAIVVANRNVVWNWRHFLTQQAVVPKHAAWRCSQSRLSRHHLCSNNNNTHGSRSCSLARVALLLSGSLALWLCACFALRQLSFQGCALRRRTNQLRLLLLVTLRTWLRADRRCRSRAVDVAVAAANWKLFCVWKVKSCAKN